VVVHLAAGETLERQIPLHSREAKFDIRLPAMAVRVDADPRFDLFRRLLPGESPATLSGLFGNDGKFSYLVFAGPEPANERNGQWKTTDSDLMV
jgi:hypothetical protein